MNFDHFHKLLNLVLLLSFFLFSHAGKSKKTTSQSNTNGEATYIELSKILNVQNKPILTLTDSNFTKFVQSRPRNYHAAFFLTASNKKYQCSVCKKAAKIYKQAALHYIEQYNFSKISMDKRIAFFYLDLDSSRNVFNSLNLETVPKLFILPPASVEDAKQIASKFEVPPESILEGVPNLISEIKTLTGIEIQIRMDATPILAILCFISIILAFIYSLASIDFNKSIYWYRNSTFWMLFSILCFGVGVSGTLYCIIRSAPSYGFDREGNIDIFSGQSREQYLLEGIVVAIFTIGIAVSLIMIYYSTKIQYAILRHIFVMIAMSAFVVLSIQVWNAYVDKTRWYSVKETLPAEIWGFLTATVKKKSYLPKRLLRISEIWLYDFKDWDSFLKKVKSLLWDYILRALSISESN